MIDQIVRGRRSIRKFTDQSVDWEMVESIVEAGTWAPSACNLQRWEFVAVTDSELKRRICIEAQTSELVFQAPVVIVVLYDRAFDSELHDHLQSVSAAIQNMLLKAYDLGLGTLWMASIKKPEKLQELINAPRRLFPAALVLVGYPAHQPKAPFRRPVSVVLHHDRFNGNLIPVPSSTDPRNWTNTQINEFRERYIRARAGYAWRRRMTFYEQILLDWIVEQHNGAEITDILSGYGAHLFYLSRYIDRFTVVERSQELLRFLKDEILPKSVSIEEHLIDGYAVPIPDESCQIVLCFECLEQVPEPDKLLRETYRILKPNGRLFLVVRNKWSVWQFSNWLSAIKDRSLLHAFFGPMKLLSPKVVIDKTVEVGLKPRFVAGTRLARFIPDRKVQTAILKYFCKYLLFECVKKSRG